MNMHAPILLTAACAGAFLVFPAEAMAGAEEALILWAGSVFPALFPFCGAVLLFRALGGMEKAERLLYRLPFGPLLAPVLSAWCGGYPMGAVLAAEEKDPAARKALVSLLLCSGPVFMLGTAGAGLLGSVKLGGLLLLCHYLGAAANFLLFKKTKTAGRTHTSRAAVPFGKALAESMEGAMLTMLRVLGCMMLIKAFLSALYGSGAPEILLSLLPLGGRDRSVLGALFSGCMEMSLGLSELAALSLPLPMVLPIMAFILGFGGLSVLLQALSFLPEGPGFLTLLWLKFRHGLLSAGFVALFTRLFPALLTEPAVQTFLSEGSLQNMAQISLFLAGILALVPLIFFAVLGGFLKIKRF